MELLEDNEKWEFVGQGLHLGKIQIDLDVSLTIKNSTFNDWVRLDVGNGSKLTLDGREHMLDAQQAMSIAPLLPLLNTAVNNVTLTKEGRLNAAFTSGATLEVGPDERYEAWKVGCLIDGVGHLFVCAPGGEVAFFKGTKDHPRGAATKSEPIL